MGSELRIKSTDFWRVFISIYDVLHSRSHITLRNNPKATKNLGLEFIKVDRDNEPYYIFCIIDKKKWAFTRLKYGF
jgi:hypothetical protein